MLVTTASPPAPAPPEGAERAPGEQAAAVGPRQSRRRRWPRLFQGSQRPRRPRRAVTAALVAATTAAAVLAVAEIIPLPGLSYSLMLGAWGLDWLALLVGLSALALLARRRHRSRARTLALVLAVVATLITGAVGARQISYAHDHGVDLDVAALTGIGQAGAAPDLEPLILDDVETGQALRAGIWRPRDPQTGLPLSEQQLRAIDPRGVPVVVLLHGGGWSNGNRLNPMTRGQADWFARQGYLAIALDYPLSTPRLATWQLAPSRSACGLAWVAEHAAEYGGDATRLALQGDSAGGNLALEITYRQALGVLESPDPACGRGVPQIDAVSVTYPVADPVGFHDNPDPVMGPFTRQRAQRYTGGSPQSHPERYAAVSPLRWARELVETGAARSLPPTLVVAGDRDHVVPVAGALELDAVLTRGQAPHETLVLPYTDHVFDLNPGSLGSQVWRSRTLAMLEEAGLGA